MALLPVTPAAPVAPYKGGKRLLAKALCARIADVDHSVFAVPFVGRGGVFFRRKLAPNTEVINDYNGEIVNLFRVLQGQYDAFMDALRFRLSSREEFNRLRELDPAALSDVERAARFLYLQRVSFGGKPDHSTLGAFSYKGGTSRFDMSKLAPVLLAAHTRLSGVFLENLGYEDFIVRYDSAATLFYLDPPYWNCEDHYGPDMFSKADFDRLAALLSALKGRFIMSLNDTPEVREIFSAFKVDAVETHYSIQAAKSTKVGEVIISN